MQIFKFSLATALFTIVTAADDVTLTEHSSTLVTITECASTVTNCPFTSAVNTSMTVSTVEGMANRDTFGPAGVALAIAGGILAL